MNKYIKPETKIVEVKIETLLNDASFGGNGNGIINGGGTKGQQDAWDNSASKNHRPGNLWDSTWEDEDDDDNN